MNENEAARDDLIKQGLNVLVSQCFAASYKRGWWHDPITGLSLIPGELSWPDGEHPLQLQLEVIKAWFPYVIATKIALIHSEVSEGLEAYRVDAVDDKIPFPGITAEMADVVIRVADLMGCLKLMADMDSFNKGEYELGGAIIAKLPVNAGRADHDLSERAKPGGKKF